MTANDARLGINHRYISDGITIKQLSIIDMAIWYHGPTIDTYMIPRPNHRYLYDTGAQPSIHQWYRGPTIDTSVIPGPNHRYLYDTGAQPSIPIWYRGLTIDTYMIPRPNHRYYDLSLNRHVNNRKKATWIWIKTNEVTNPTHQFDKFKLNGKLILKIIMQLTI